MGEFVIGLGIGAVVAGLLSSFMYFVLFYKEDKSDHHLPETKVNIPMPELRPCKSCRNHHSHHGVCDICKDFSCWAKVEGVQNKN